MTSAASSKSSASSIAGRYPRTIKLRDGKKLELRLMAAGDQDQMVAFAKTLPPDDLLFLRRNITEPEAVSDWIREVESGQSVTILGLVGDELAGYSALHFNPAAWMRHLGEIRLLTGTNYRMAGAGRALASEVFAVAQLSGLRKLTAQMTLDQAGARSTFERLGFKPEALLTDWVMGTNGRTRDLLIMALDLEGLTDTVDA